MAKSPCRFDDVMSEGRVKALHLEPNLSAWSIAILRGFRSWYDLQSSLLKVVRRYCASRKASQSVVVLVRRSLTCVYLCLYDLRAQFLRGPSLQIEVR